MGLRSMSLALGALGLVLASCRCRPCCPTTGFARVVPAGTGVSTPTRDPREPAPPKPEPRDPLDPPYFMRVKIKNASPQPPKDIASANVAGFSRFNCTFTASFPQQFPPPPSDIGATYPIVDTPPLSVGQEREWPPTGTPVNSLPQAVRSVNLQLQVDGDANPCAACIPAPAGKKLQSVDIEYVGKNAQSQNLLQYVRTWYREWDEANKKWIMESDAAPLQVICVE